jgi:hypothetical protein
MKLLLLVVISLLSPASPSFGMLDDPLVKTKISRWGGKVKDLRPKGADLRSQDPRYKGRSAILLSNCPKMPIIQAHNQFRTFTPFSAELTQARAPQPLKDLIAQQLPDHQVVYSFSVQLLRPNPTRAENQLYPGSPATHPNDPFVLKPHYLVHPDAPYIREKRDYETDLRWTVLSGVEGKIEPVAGAGLHSNVVYTRHSGALNGRMGLSGNLIPLKGIEIRTPEHKRHTPEHNRPLHAHRRHFHGHKHHFHERKGSYTHVLSKPQDLYSLVAFTDEKTGKKIAAVTYHWLLSTGDWMESGRNFKKVLKKAKTFREFIDGRPPEFEGIGAHAPFQNLVGELKRYVDFSPKEAEPIIPVQVSQKPDVKQLVPQKKVPSPSQKPALQTKATPVKVIAKATPIRKANVSPVTPIVQKPVVQPTPPTPTAKVAPARTNVKVVPVRKVATTPSVIQRPATQPKTPSLAAKVASVRTNVKVVPVRKVATTPSVIQRPATQPTTPSLAAKVAPARKNTKVVAVRKVATTPSVIQRPATQPKTPSLAAKVAPARKNTKAVPARKGAIAPSVIRKLATQPKTSSLAAKVAPARTNTKVAPKKAAVLAKKDLVSKVAPKKAHVHKFSPKKAPVCKATPKKTLI